MRKILFAGANIMTILIIFSSCQKEADFNIPNQVQADSSYLHRYIGLDTTRPPGTDTTEKGFFFYDGQKRLIRYYFVQFGGFDTITIELRYSGTDSLPYLEIRKQLNNSGPGTYSIDSAFYTYNNAVVKKDSIISWRFPGALNDGVVASDYMVAGSNVKRYDRYYNLIGGIYVLGSIDSGIYTVSYTSGNLSTQSLTDGNGYFISVQATYDNKPNPLSKVLKTKYPNFEGYFLDNWGIQPNNPLQVQSQPSFNPVQTELFTYKYRADGYPTVVNYFDSGGFSAFNKVLYFYTSL